MTEEKMAPVHPGEILIEDFMKPLGISQYRLAKAMNVYPRKINEIIQGKRSITADTALRLARFFGTSPEVWMNLQAHYDLELAKDALEEAVTREVTPYLDLRQAGQVLIYDVKPHDTEAVKATSRTTSGS